VSLKWFEFHFLRQFLDSEPYTFEHVDPAFRPELKDMKLDL